MRSNPKKVNRNLAKALNILAREDQKAIRKIRKTKIFNDNVQRANTQKMKRIIKEYGWPRVSGVGKKASRNAWLVVQHADHDLRFQKRCLALMKEVCDANPHDVALQDVAFLEDRIMVNQGKKQTFGSQFYVNKKGIFTHRPIKDFNNLDKRRKKYGLPPFSEYEKIMRSWKPLDIKGFRQK